MRQRAHKLEKGKWYADSMYEGHEAFIRFDEYIDDKFIFSEQKGKINYRLNKEGKIPFSNKPHTFHVTKEDIEKYKLNEKE